VHASIAPLITSLCARPRESHPFAFCTAACGSFAFGAFAAVSVRFCFCSCAGRRRIEQPNVYAVGDAARLVAQRLHALHPPPLPDAAKPGTPKAYSA
jgi:hypothetical protein